MFCRAEGVGASCLLEAEGRRSFLREVTSEKGKCCSPALQWKFGELGTPGLGPPWVHHAQQQQQRQTMGLHGAVCLSVDVRGKGCYLQQVFFARTMLVTGADTSRACPWQPRVPIPHLCPPRADPVPAAPVLYTGTISGLQRWLPILEGFWLQQPVRKSCKSLFFWAQQGRLRTGRTFCGGLGTTGFGDSGSSMGLAASRASAPCPRFHFYPLVLGFLPSYRLWCLQRRLLRAQPPVGTSTCLLEVLGGCSPSRSVPFSGGKRGKSRSRVLRGSQSPVCGGSLHRHELFTPSAPLPDTSRLLPQPLTPRSAIQQRQRLQNL